MKKIEYRDQALKILPWVCGKCGRDFSAKTTGSCYVSTAMTTNTPAHWTPNGCPLKIQMRKRNKPPPTPLSPISWTSCVRPALVKRRTIQN